MVRTKIDFKKLPASLTLEQYDWLRKKAFERKVSMNHIIRELVQGQMTRENPQGRLI